MSEIVAAFLRTAQAGKAADEKRTAEAAAAQRAAEERAHRAELIHREEQRVRALYRASANLERATRIRQLVAVATEAAMAEGQPVDPGTAFWDWLVWASQQADRLIP